MGRNTSSNLIGALFAAVLLLVGAMPASAQDGGRFRVLVPNLEPQQNADDHFGKDVADKLRDKIGDLATHAPVSDRDLKDALKKFKIDEDDLNCLRARQLAVQLGAELVMCGSYTEPSRRQYQVSASFMNARTGERFDVDPFPSGDDKQAAQHIFDEFRTYIDQLRQTAFCLEYLGSQQYENALDNCNKAVESNPQSLTARFAVARAKLGIAEKKDANDQYVMPEAERKQMYAQVLEGLQTILEKNPVHQEALQTAGFVAVKLDQRAQALDYYRQYLELNPNASNVRITVATDLANAGDPQGALALMEEGIQLAGDSADATLLEYAGHFASNAASAIESGNLAQTDMSPEQLYTRALQYYDRVYQARGQETDPSLLSRMIQALVSVGRNDEAVQRGSEFVQEFPDNASLLDVYANALNQAGRTQDAIEALKKLATLNPDARVYARQGLWLTRAGNFSGAKAAFQQAVQRGEASPDELAEVLFGVGYNQFYKNGKTDGAMDAFAASRDLARDATKKARAAFWQGYILYQRGQKLQEPSTAASARQALPLFNQALDFFQNSAAYANNESSINLPQIIDATKQFIEIQELLIKRGK